MASREHPAATVQKSDCRRSDGKLFGWPRGRCVECGALCGVPHQTDCSHARSAATCHVFVVSRFVLPTDKPDDACFECGEPLAVHEKRTSSLIPRDKVFVIDEKALNV